MTARTFAALGLALALGAAHADAAQPVSQPSAARSVAPSTGDAGAMRTSPTTTAKPAVAKPMVAKPMVAKPVATKTVATKPVATKAATAMAASTKLVRGRIGMATISGKRSSLAKVAGVRHVARAHRAHLSAAKTLRFPHLTRVHKTVRTHLAKLVTKRVAKHA